jgi:hypothetical protein
MRIRLLFPVLLLVACKPERQAAAPAAIDSVRLAEARAAASALGGDLMAMLTRELARGGPDAAIAVCADSAQARTAQHQRVGISVRRVGTRVRNPLNAPDSLETDLLAALQRDLEAGHLPADTIVVEALTGGHTRLRYLRPVRLQEQCLTCHGPAPGIPASVKAVLARRYPNDQATGYNVGDLRGAVSVQLDQN